MSSRRRLVPDLELRSWRPFATRTRRAVTVGAAVQIVVLLAYFAAVPEVDRYVVLAGLVGGLAGSVIAPHQRGLWVEGAGAATLGLAVFLLGFVGWGGYQATHFEGIVAGRVLGVYISTAVTYAIMLLPAFAVDGLLMGVVVGWLRRSDLPIGL
jgi:hypothetical protein